MTDTEQMNETEKGVEETPEIEVAEGVENVEAIENAEDAEDDQPENEDVPLDPAHLRLLEGVLFATDEPMTERMLANRLPEGAPVLRLLKKLQSFYEARGVQLIRAGKSWAFRTAPDIAAQLNKEMEVARKLSRAAIETLAIMAYHQPVTRAEIEEIRGVSISKGTMDVLFEEGWIKPRGRRQTPGRPMTWGTTDGFLDHFGLSKISDLPGIEELKAAGLLDARPAIEAYRVTGDVGEKGGHNEELPLPIEGEEEKLLDEPLDPDDDYIPGGDEEIEASSIG